MVKINLDGEDISKVRRQQFEVRQEKIVAVLVRSSLARGQCKGAFAFLIMSGRGSSG